MAQTPNPRDSPGQDCERGYVSLGASIPEPPPWPFNISSPRHLAFSLDSLSHLSQHQTHALHSNVREWTQPQKRLPSESRQGVCKARPRGPRSAEGPPQAVSKPQPRCAGSKQTCVEWTTRLPVHLVLRQAWDLFCGGRNGP